MAYRISRNFEASVIKFLENNFVLDWNGVRVEKSQARVYNGTLPVVCVQLGVTNYNYAEVGSDSIIRTPLIIIDIYAKNDGQRLDLKDYIISKVKSGMPYYEFIIENGNIVSQNQTGNIMVKKILDVPVNFDVDKDKLDKSNRYRHRITLTTTINVAE